MARIVILLLASASALVGCGLAGTGVAGAAGGASEAQEAAQAHQTEDRVKQQIGDANQQAEAAVRAAEKAADSQSQ